MSLKSIKATAWKIRWILLAGVFTGAEVVLPFIEPNMLPRGVLASVSAVIVAGRFITSMLARWQEKKLEKESAKS